MDFRTMMAEVARLSVEAHKFAAIGAVLRMRLNGKPVPPEVDASLRDVITALIPGGLDQLTPDEIEVALNYIVFQTEEARELLREPARAPMWCIDDPDVLQSMGDISRMLPRRMLAFAVDRPALAAAFTGRFLDVGTGVGAITLEAAARCPTLRVVGLDIWDPALALARANVAASPNAARIEIRKQSITELNETAAYTVAFLAAPFMARDLVEVALDRLAVAVAADGYLVVAIYVPRADPVMDALDALRLVRGGGHPWTVAEMAVAVTARGFTDVEAQPGPLARGISPTLVFARRLPHSDPLGSIAN
jgi:precorrin-6B methylase 2